MSEKNLTIKKEDTFTDAHPPMTPELNDELYYNCSECSSLIEIISINEDNNTIEFNCLNKEKNHPKRLSISLRSTVWLSVCFS